jgi:hypothetical protein
VTSGRTRGRRSESDNQKTVIAIEAAGAKAGTSGNLRIGLDTLGIRFDELVLLRREVSDWAKAIIAIYRAELKTKGVL